MAPSMEQIEEQFRNQVNFVVIDGSAEKNYDLVRAAVVDFLPAYGTCLMLFSVEISCPILKRELTHVEVCFALPLTCCLSDTKLDK